MEHFWNTENFPLKNCSFLIQRWKWPERVRSEFNTELAEEIIFSPFLLTLSFSWNRKFCRSLGIEKANKFSVFPLDWFHVCYLIHNNTHNFNKKSPFLALPNVADSNAVVFFNILWLEKFPLWLLECENLHETFYRFLCLRSQKPHAFLLWGRGSSLQSFIAFPFDNRRQRQTAKNRKASE